MREVLLTINDKVFEGRKTITMTNNTHTCTLECVANTWSSPFYGKIIKANEIKEIIDFLLQTLEEKESDEQSDME